MFYCTCVIERHGVHIYALSLVSACTPFLACCADCQALLAALKDVKQAVQKV